MDQNAATEGNPANLSHEQLTLLRDKLEALRTQLLTRRSNDEGIVRDDEATPIEAMEAAVRTRDQDDAILAVDRERSLLVDVDDALAKLASGRYGLSETSGAPIGFRRLQAIPWARQTADEEEGT